MFISMNPRSSARRPAPLRTRLRAAACDAILDAAEAVAAERGLDGASIAAIAERAGVAVGTLYNYFPDREGILTALFTVRRGELVPRITAIAEAHASEPFERRLRGFVRDVMAAYEERRSFLRLAIDADRTMPKVKDPRQTLLVHFAATLETIFADAGRAKQIAPGHHVAYARMMQGALKGLTLLHIEKGTPLTDDAELAVDTFLHGVRGKS
jgi:AcrR family transcriptional regulator